MILSNRRIQEALDKKWLVIEPEPLPRQLEPGRDCPFQTSAVDLRLGDEIAWLREGLPLTIDLRRGGFADLFSGNSLSQRITSEQPFVLSPNRFVLGKTLERVTLPLLEHQPSLAARVEGRSSYARCGLLVHFTAPTIHAGYSGHVTLEMANFGPYPISLFPGTFICQLILEQVDGNPFPNESQFQNQTSAGGSKR